MIQSGVNGAQLFFDNSQEKLHINPELLPSRNRGRWGTSRVLLMGNSRMNRKLDRTFRATRAGQQQEINFILFLGRGWY